MTYFYSKIIIKNSITTFLVDFGFAQSTFFSWSLLRLGWLRLWLLSQAEVRSVPKK